MGTLDLNTLFNAILQDTKNIAVSTFSNYKKEASADAEKLFERLEVKLKKWTQQLINEDISKDDFKFLINGEKDLIELKALEKIGIAAIELDKLRVKIINSIFQTITGKI